MEREELKSIFKEITLTDDQVAESMLEASNWNVETAIHLYTGGSESNMNTRVPSAPEASVNRDSHTHTDTQTHTHTHTHDIVSTHTPTFTSSIIRYLIGSLKFLWDLVYKTARVLGVFFFGVKASRQNFTETFENRFGLSHPNFFEGRFGEVMGHARTLKLPVAVYVHSDAARDTRQFCSELLSHHAIVEYMNKNYVTWAVDTMCRDVVEVTRALNVRKYPHMSIVWPGVMFNNHNQLAVVEGIKTVEEMLSIFRGCEDRIEALQVELATREEDYRAQRLLRETQDLEYQETLKRDREREQDRRKKEDKEKLKKQKSLEYEAKKQEIMDNLRQSRTAKAEAWKDKRSTVEAESVLNTNICLRLPDGKRLEHKFNKDEKIYVLYEWVEICEILHSVTIPPSFQLKTPLGQSAITDMEQTFADYDLHPSSAVMLTHIKGILDEMWSEIENME